MKKTNRVITRLRVLILLLVISLVAVLAYSVSREPQAPSIPELATYRVKIDDVENIVSGNGNVAPRAIREIYLPQGKIIEINKKLGKFVKKDSLLAKIEVTTALGTTEVRDITSPIAGTVIAVNVNLNDTVFASTQPAFMVANEKSYQIEVNINENDIFELATGQDVELVFPAISLDDKYDGKVKSIDPAPLAVAGAVEYRVVINILEEPSELKLGMSADVEIMADLVEDVIAIPESFLIEKNDKYFVKKIIWSDEEQTDYTTQEIFVETGLITDALVEIEDGLQVGDLLLEPSFVEERQGQLSIFE